MIRRATEQDIPALVQMGKAFVATTSYQSFLSISPEHLSRLITAMLANDQMAVWVADVNTQPVGMIAMQTFEHPMSGERVASEVVWWVDPAARGTVGIRLLKTAEQWAREQDAAVLQMVAPNAHVGAFYERVGYSAVETSYQKRMQ